MNNSRNLRYIARDCEVWDTAWSNPFTGDVTAGLRREQVVTTWSSPFSARDAADALNRNDVNGLANLDKFRRAAKQALADVDNNVRRLLDSVDVKEPRADWLDGIEGLETL